MDLKQVKTLAKQKFFNKIKNLKQEAESENWSEWRKLKKKEQLELWKEDWKNKVEKIILTEIQKQKDYQLKGVFETVEGFKRRKAQAYWSKSLGYGVLEIFSHKKAINRAGNFGGWRVVGVKNRVLKDLEEINK